MNNRLALLLLVIAVIFVGTLAFKGNQEKKQEVKEKKEATRELEKEVQKTVDLTNSGFEPSSIKIKKNTRLIWVNKTSQNATVNSAEYPTNRLYPFLNLGEFASGSSVQAVFKETGSFRYHNFHNPKQIGTVVVE